jgi:hypothetical protein
LAAGGVGALAGAGRAAAGRTVELARALSPYTPNDFGNTSRI